MEDWVMGFVLLASFFGIIEAVFAFLVFDLGALPALGVWSLGGNFSAMLVMAVCRRWPAASSRQPAIPEYEPDMLSV
jgi:predicted outer membrane lipoprotein